MLPRPFTLKSQATATLFNDYALLSYHVVRSSQMGDVVMSVYRSLQRQLTVKYAPGQFVNDSAPAWRDISTGSTSVQREPSTTS